ncbi:hypothetical protein Dda_0614 [Drechslerella dactyloides]|uniref:BZIP domain-containing protein n=1 Tax=Drechslerella dactyloides TaxID=74499 RepID=A0AAD6J4T4_DREDA|nr:hypothetical protein Dda_0614 [Drechslerella dactyloides]
MAEIPGDRLRRGHRRESTPSMIDMEHYARSSHHHPTSRRRESTISEHEVESFIVDPLVQSWGDEPHAAHAGGSFTSASHHRALTVTGPQLLDSSAYLGMLTAEPHADSSSSQLFSFHSGLDAYSVPSPGHQYEYLGAGVGGGMSDRSNLPWFSAPASPAHPSADYFSSLARMQDAEFSHGVAPQDFTDVYHQGDLDNYPHPGDISRLHGPASSAGISRGRKRSSGSRRGGFEGDFVAMDIERENMEQFNQEDTEKKHRGRPRLDNRDETAAERRRTQIRLAQRAYRQRKETTIASLKNRVEELESTIETMLNTFFEIHDSAIEHKVIEAHPQFGRTLRSATERILALSKEIGSSAAAGDEGEHDGEEQPKDGGKQRGADEEEGFFSGPAGTVHHGPSRSRSTGSRESQTSVGNVTPAAPGDTFNLARIRASIPSRLQSPSPHTSKILPPNEERTFAQRLRRLALEWRYYRLVNGNQDVTRENQPANFCLLFATKDETLESLRLLLSGRDREPYQLARFPISNLGGSGLHYRVERNLNGSLREIRVGSREQDLASKTADHLRIALINRGFGDRADEIIPLVVRLEEEGLLDPDEVEAVLALRGIRLTTTSASPTSPILVSRSEQRYQFQDAYPGGPADTSPPYNLPPVLLPQGGGEDVVMEGASGSSGSYRPAGRQYQDFSHSKEVKVDILLRELVLRGICTGTGMAFRKVDVEAALTLAASS